MAGADEGREYKCGVDKLLANSSGCGRTQEWAGLYVADRPEAEVVYDVTDRSFMRANSADWHHNYAYLPLFVMKV